MKLALLFLTHFVADFLLQSRKMGKNKSSSWKYLGMHISIIFLAFLPFGFLFALINALCHAIIDRNIWNLYKIYAANVIQTKIERDLSHVSEEFLLDWNSFPTKKEEFVRTKAKYYSENFKYWEDHWFYATIGFDQLLHALTLIVLYNNL